jgi:hypothetical protein
MFVQSQIATLDTHAHKSRAITPYGTIRGCYPTTKTTIYTTDTIHIGRHKQRGTVTIPSVGTTGTGLTGKENGSKKTNCA